MKAEPRKVSEELSYEKFYLENYEEIKNWALQISGYNCDEADELVQELYLKLYGRECPQNTESVRAYIYVSLKNTFQTHLRRKKLGKMISLAENTDFLESFYNTDPRPVLKTRDQIREICAYVCRRKETSIAAGIFILKFFHGYTLSEISLISKRRKNAVEARLVKIRAEIDCLPDKPPSSHHKFNEKYILKVSEKATVSSNIWAEIRQIIVSHRSGMCPALEELRELYADEQIKIERRNVSHFVCCPRCLNRINNLLDLPTFTDRLVSAAAQQIILLVLFFLQDFPVPFNLFLRTLKNPIKFFLIFS